MRQFTLGEEAYTDLIWGRSAEKAWT